MAWWARWPGVLTSPRWTHVTHCAEARNDGINNMTDNHPRKNSLVFINAAVRNKGICCSSLIPAWVGQVNRVAIGRHRSSSRRRRELLKFPRRIGWKPALRGCVRVAVDSRRFVLDNRICPVKPLVLYAEDDPNDILLF